MSVRFRKTPQGEIAILPRRDYEALVARADEADEDVGTARLVEAAKADIAAGAFLLPLRVANRLADGENPVRVLREWRDLTQTRLSCKTDISEAHISNIESGLEIGSASTLALIANALDVPFELLRPSD